MFPGKINLEGGSKTIMTSGLLGELAIQFAVHRIFSVEFG